MAKKNRKPAGAAAGAAGGGSDSLSDNSASGESNSGSSHGASDSSSSDDPTFLNQTVQTLHKIVKDLQEENKDLQDHCERLEKETMELKEEETANNITQALLQEQIDEAIKEKAKYEETIDDLSKNFNQLQNEQNNSLAKIANLETQILDRKSTRLNSSH